MRAERRIALSRQLRRPGCQKKKSAWKWGSEAARRGSREARKRAHGAWPEDGTRRLTGAVLNISSCLGARCATKIAVLALKEQSGLGVYTDVHPGERSGIRGQSVKAFTYEARQLLRRSEPKRDEATVTSVYRTRLQPDIHLTFAIRRHPNVLAPSLRYSPFSPPRIEAQHAVQVLQEAREPHEMCVHIAPR